MGSGVIKQKIPLPQKELIWETLNKYSMDKNCSGNPMLFAGEGARATLVQSLPNGASRGSLWQGHG
jgi:hypothetical protein